MEHKWYASFSRGFDHVGKEPKNQCGAGKAPLTRLATAPHRYGEPHRKTLHGYWKLRVGDYRVVFKIIKAEVRILAIIRRKRVHDEVESRL
jgi:mRNA interferase RelE/StbE